MLLDTFCLGIFLRKMPDMGHPGVHSQKKQTYQSTTVNHRKHLNP